MGNYDLITSKEYRYLIYLCEELSKIHNSFLGVVDDRDVKLSLLLKSDLSGAYDSAIEEVDKIRVSIDGLDINNLVSSELDVIGHMVDKLVDYFDYFNYRVTSDALEDESGETFNSIKNIV